MFDRVVAYLTGALRHVCRRCGWRGRLKPLPPSTEADAEREARRSRRRSSLEPAEAAPHREVELDALDQQIAQAITHQPFDPAEEHTHPPAARTLSSDKARRSKRRQVAGGIALSAALMLVVVMMLLATDCAGRRSPEARSNRHIAAVA